MPRAPRITPAGFVFHVLNRAIERATLFKSASDYQQFYRLLFDTLVHVPMRIIAYCFMPNHWHLVLWPLTDGAITAYLQRVTAQHSLRFRRRTGTVGRGHLYQARFRCFPVESGRYYYNLIRYVEANAVESGLVARAEAWPWSSLADRRRRGGRLTTDGPLPLPEDWIEWVNIAASDAEHEMLQHSERSGRPYGSPDWVEQVAASQGLGQTLHAPGRRRAIVRRICD